MIFPKEPFEIKGLPGTWRKLHGVTYDYDGADRCKCPSCGGLGSPWGGWFSCGDCDCHAWIETGEVILPIKMVVTTKTGCLP